MEKRRIVLAGSDSVIMRALITSRRDIETRFRAELEKVDAVIKEQVDEAAQRAGYDDGLEWHITSEGNELILNGIEPPLAESEGQGGGDG
jgi:hypothetical protein